MGLLKRWSTVLVLVLLFAVNVHSQKLSEEEPLEGSGNINNPDDEDFDASGLPPEDEILSSTVLQPKFNDLDGKEASTPYQQTSESSSTSTSTSASTSTSTSTLTSTTTSGSTSLESTSTSSATSPRWSFTDSYNPSSTSDHSDSAGIDSTTIVIIVTVVLVILIVLFVAIYMLRKRQSQPKYTAATPAGKEYI